MLVVEDDFISRRLLSRYLEPSGECDVATDGNEAMVATKRALNEGRPYDLICLDIMMPGLDGQQTLTAIRQCEAENNILFGNGARIVMTTALEDHDNVMQAFRNQCDGYIIKPIEKRKFLETLKKIGLDITVDI